MAPSHRANVLASGSLHNAIPVALGAVPGAWLRFRLVNHLAPLLPKRHWATFGVNAAACFALGLFSALLPRCPDGSRLALLLATGFLGSLSTFSTFILELLLAWQQGERRQALILVLGSVVGGVAALLLGLEIGR
jgi:CrcB protein